MAGLLETFPGRFITEILSELERLPVGLLDETLEVRAYRQAKTMTDDAGHDKAAIERLPTTPLFKLVREIERDLVQEDIDRDEDT